MKDQYQIPKDLNFGANFIGMPGSFLVSTESQRVF